MYCARGLCRDDVVGGLGDFGVDVELLAVGEHEGIHVREVGIVVLGLFHYGGCGAGLGCPRRIGWFLRVLGVFDLVVFVFADLKIVDVARDAIESGGSVLRGLHDEGVGIDT